ncbi:MAG: Holliday junction resolvase RuvX [Candidatus Caldatribacteriota bacterium]|nr:Holliday junction resolvase RuvX [Candidatus Caldatribacteriota bacterium]
MSRIEIILAIDPGTKKCGYAVVDAKLKLKLKKVVSTKDLIVDIKEISHTYSIDKVVLGDGTNYKIIEAIIKEKFPQLNIELADEKFSTLKARKRYFELYPPQGIFKFIPLSLRIPPCDYDDIVAVLLAENYFESKISR